MVSEASPLRPNDKEDEKHIKDYAATATVYLVAFGIATQGVASLASQYFLKDTFDLGPASVAFYLGFHSIGWIIKPIWGFISDSYPIFGERRRPYLVLVSGCASLAFFAYGWVSSVLQFVIVLITTNACMSFLTVIAQALLVQRSSAHSINHASFNFSSYFGAKISFSAVAVFCAGMMLDTHTPRVVLMSCAACYLPCIMVAAFMKDTKRLPTLDVIEQIGSMHQLFARREVWGVTLYIFVFCAMPNASSAMFFFNIDVLHFSPSFIATIAVVSSVAQVVGLIVYHKFLNRVPFRRLFAMATLLCTVVSLTPLIQVFRLNRQWGIDDHVFAMVDTFVIMAVLEILWIPMLVLASRLCKSCVEGTVFAVFLSIHNLGASMSGVQSALLTWALGISRTDFDNLWLLIVICSVATMFPLILLPLLPVVDPEVCRESTGMIAPGTVNPQDA